MSLNDSNLRSYSIPMPALLVCLKTPVTNGGRGTPATAGKVYVMLCCFPRAFGHTQPRRESISSVQPVGLKRNPIWPVSRHVNPHGVYNPLPAKRQRAADGGPEEEGSGERWRLLGNACLINKIFSLKPGKFSE